MNPDVFFQNFELLADAPNGVQKLREIILQLAVMGKLVPQNPEDESASVLIEIIKVEKKRLVKEKEIKSIKVKPIDNKELPFELPVGWEFCRLGDITKKLGAGSTPLGGSSVYQESGIKFIRSQNVWNNGLKLENIAYISSEIHERMNGTFVEPGDILLNITGASIGRSSVVPDDFDDGNVNQHVSIVRLIAKATREYLHLCIISPYIQALVMSEQVGISREGLSMTRLKEFLIPIPPLVEQKLIVSKVDELMSLCDKLEARRQKKQEIQSKLNSAALNRMFSAENQEEFEQNWQRICENFDLLYDNPENVGKLKQAILQLAVQGKLVEQDLKDEPASVLIEKIMGEKKNLVEVGKIKGTKSVSLETTDNRLILPEKWELVNLDSIILFMDAGWSPACKNHPTEDEQTWGVLKTTSVQPLMFLWAEHKELPENLTPRPEYEVKAGDILITRAGPKNRVGICCLVKDTRSHLMISDKIIRFHLLDEFVFPEFVTLCLNTGFSQSVIESQKSGMAESQMNISQNKLRMTPIPLPPLAEQKRIVEKVEQLMGLCDELESKLRKSREDSGKLMETVVRGLLEGGAAEI